jgi:hypothetical protein
MEAQVTGNQKAESRKQKWTKTFGLLVSFLLSAFCSLLSAFPISAFCFLISDLTKT